MLENSNFWDFSHLTSSFLISDWDIEAYESDLQDFKMGLLAGCDTLSSEVNIYFPWKKKGKDLLKEIGWIRKQIERLSWLSLEGAYFSFGKPYRELEQFINIASAPKNWKRFWQEFLKEHRNSLFSRSQNRLNEIREIIRSAKAKLNGGAVFSEISNRSKESNPTKEQTNGKPETQETPMSIDTVAHKVDTIACRVGNILGSPTASHAPELERMLERLNAMGSSDWEVIEKIDATRARIQEILLQLTEMKNKTQKEDFTWSLPEARHASEDISEDKDQEITYPQNLMAIEYIDNLLGRVTHKLSSTKKNSANTCWDGSFVTKILRPFLNALRNELLVKNRIDAQMTSWNEIAEKHETHVHNPYKGVMSFVWLLKKSETKKDLQTLLQNELMEAVEAFSRVWVANKGRSLRNVVEALRN